MNPVRLVLHQVRYEQLSYWRNPTAAFFTFAFPLAFFFIFASIFGSQRNGDLGGVKSIQYYTPSILGYAIMSACFVNIALMLSQRRESGVLKRLRGTPLPAWALVAGVIGSSLIISAVLTAVSLVFARVAYGVHLPLGNLAAVVVTVLLAAIAFCAMGIAVSSLIPNADSGPAVVNLPYFILVFVSGTYFPVHGALAKVANKFPLRPFIQGLYRSFNPFNVGSVWAWHQVAVIAVWGAGAAVFAARRFRWEPRRG